MAEQEQMMQYPLIKDGVVVNIIELGEGTRVVDKPTYKSIAAEDEGRYESELSEWREATEKHREAIRQAELQLFMATGHATATKSKARSEKGNAEAHLERVLVADAEVEAWAAKVEDMKRHQYPAKPRFVRTKAWMVPPGHEVGIPGGHIGDRWDGEKYIEPEGKRIPEEQTLATDEKV